MSRFQRFSPNPYLRAHGRMSARAGQQEAVHRVPLGIEGGVPEDFDEEDFDEPPRRRTGIRSWLTAILVGSALAGALWVVAHSTLFGDDPVLGHVVGGPWQMRTGPSTDNPVFGRIYDGHPVAVICVVNGWALLSEPKENAYVARRALVLDAPPPLCDR